MAIISSDTRKKTVHFGAAGMSDYTIHKDDDRKERYIKRHSVNENFNDVYSAGFYSRWILWNKKSIRSSIADTKQRFNLNIKFQK